MLPAVWREYDADQIAQSVTEVLIRMLGLEFALMLVRGRQGDRVVHRLAAAARRAHSSSPCLAARSLAHSSRRALILAS